MKRITLFNFFTKRNQVNLVLIVVASVLTVLYSGFMGGVEPEHNILTIVLLTFKYVPIVLATALGGIVPGMVCVLIVFTCGSVVQGGLMYSAFVYLLVSCAADIFTKLGFYKNIWKVLAASAILQVLLGDICGFLRAIISDGGMGSFGSESIIPMFFMEMPACFLACLLLHILYKTVPDYLMLLCGNGMYYVDIDKLDEDDKYIVEGNSKLGNEVMKIIVFEAFVLGLIAELASRELYIEMTLRRGVELAMLISIVVTPLSIFVNNYAQYRIARPVRSLAKAFTDIYNSEDGELSGSVENVHRLRIETNDEIEDLYHAIDLMLYRFMDYIEIVRSRKGIEDQLRVEKSANEAKSRFLSNMSHEIRTPINAVLGFDELILRESDDEKILSYAADIQSSGKTLLALINDILDFSKIEAGKMEIIPVEYETCSMLNDVINMIEIKAEEKGLEFVTNIGEDIPSVLFGDETRIKQCIMNLLSNAVKYTHKGTVTMVVYRKDYEPVSHEDVLDERIVLGVRIIDTGIGIKEEDIDKLTSAFERIDEKRNRTIEGTGLGINIVTSILSLMNSKLDVKSEYGRGSEFSFEIVQNVVKNDKIGDFGENYRLSKVHRKQYRENFHAPKAKILVVDDMKTNLTVIQGLLKKTLIAVDTALSGNEALELVKANKYDVIFLDHRMPELDGIQTLHIMKDMKENLNKNTPVVALTANAVSGSREMYFKEGFSNYLSKPVSPTKLEEMIMKYLPAYKISVPGDDDFVETEDEMAGNENGVLSEILKVRGTDVDGAIARCGSPEVLLEVMKDFRLSIKEKTDFIEKYAKEKNFKNFGVYVHGLKSSAKAIGATELSEKAAYLEKCADEKNLEEIESKTPELLKLYRSYWDKLAVIADEESEEDPNKPMISESELEEAFTSMKEFVSASYFDSADDIMNMLKEYRIPAKYTDKYNTVKRLMVAVDRDGLLNIL